MSKEARNNCRLIYVRLKYNMMAELQYPINFILQIFSMLFNNILLLVSWLFLFSKFQAINGYTYKEVFGLYSMSMISFGLAYLLNGNIFNIGQSLLDGEIDLFLTQPKDVLVNISCVKSDMVCIGDILIGLLLFFFNHSIFQTPLFICCTVCSTIILVSFVVIVETLSFRFHYSPGINKMIYNIMQSIAVYPHNIFSNRTQILTVTILPTFFISFVPVNLFYTFNLIKFLALLLITILWLIISRVLFYQILKKYKSGSLFVS